MLTDCHNHILPEIDDGSKSVEMSVTMLQMMQEQGIARVIATPHFYCHREKSVASYLERRQQKFEKLMEASPPISNILLGAEVAIEKGLCDTPDIEKLAIEGTDLILLELPYAPYQDWLEEEIDNIAMTYHLTPILAHVHRYLDWYSKAQIKQMMQFDAIFQINAEAFESFSQRKIAKEVIKRELPFLFGSDCHNLTDRKPNFDILQKKQKPEILERSNALLEQHLQKYETTRPR